MSDLESRLRAARPHVPAPTEDEYHRALGRALSRCAPRGRLVRAGRWMRRPRVLAASVALAATAGGAAALALHPWAGGSPIQVIYGRNLPTGAEPPAVPLDSPEVPPVIRRSFGHEGGTALVPGTLRRRLVADSSAGHAEIWTATATHVLPGRAAGPFSVEMIADQGGGATSTGSPVGQGAIGSPVAQRDDTIPITIGMGQTVSPGQKGKRLWSGRAAPEVASVEVITDGAPVAATVQSGYWLALWDSGATPLAVVARDAAGREIARNVDGVLSASRPGAPASTQPSFGPSPAGPEVPDVTKLPPDEAKAKLEAAGFRVEVHLESDNALNPADNVEEQIPQGGSAMAAGRVVELDGTTPATAAPRALMDRLGALQPLTAAPAPLERVPTRVLNFRGDGVASWIIDRIQDTGGHAANRGQDGAAIGGGVSLTAQGEVPSAVLWAPGAEGQAAALARRLVIDRGAPMGNLPDDLVRVTHPAPDRARVLVVLGTNPLQQSAGTP